MNIRAAVLAVPVLAALAAAGASASSFTLSPLGPSRTERVAASGDSCDAQNVPAHADMPFVDYPFVARKARVEGVAAVGITLSPTGRVVGAWRITSAGNELLDGAALRVARTSSYVAERVACASVGGDYKVEVDFSLDD